MIHKAILIPFKQDKILLQDRTGHKPPPWGFFGGSIEEGETQVQGLIRETMEELSVQITEADVKLLNVYESEEAQRVMNVYLWKCELEDSEFDLQEGKAMKWVTLDEAKELLTDKMDLDLVEDIYDAI